MPATTDSLPVAGVFSIAEGMAQLVLTERLGGHDTFLTGVLHVGGRRIPVRIFTLDDVTVLRPIERDAFAGFGATCSGILHLPHGARRRAVPADLAAATAGHGRTLEHLDDAELRYALTFLEEATTDRIRRARIVAIVAALPEADARAVESSAAPSTSSQVHASVD